MFECDDYYKNEAVVSFHQVSKYYGQKAAVKNLSFEVSRGEILALLGPNGAGKSTSMKMLTGYILPSAGEIHVCGHDVQRSTVKAQRCMGYLPEGTPLYTEATVKEFLYFTAAAREISGKEQKRAVEKAVALCGLHGVEHQLIDTLSKGYRQRTCFAQSIIHDPDVIVMDEPTDGLDPNQKHDLQLMIREMSETKSILLSTHIMEEAEFMASRVLLLRKGEAATIGKMEELRAQLGAQDRVFIVLQGVELAAAQSAFGQMPGVARVEVRENSSNALEVTLWQKGEMNLLFDVIAFCQQKGWAVDEIKRLKSGLKELFQQATRD